MTGIAIIALAVVAGLSQLLLPLLARQPAWVQAQLSQRLHRPVSFDSMEGQWTASGPLFIMRGVTVGPAQGGAGAALQLPEARLKVDFGGWLLPSRHLLNAHVRGLQLDMLHDATGWHVHGVGVAGSEQRQPLALGRLSMDLWLEDLRVAVTDATLDKQYMLSSQRLRLSRQGNQIRFGGVLRRDDLASAIHAAGRFDQDGRSGQLWVGVDGAELKPLLDGIDLGGYSAKHGSGKLAAWLDWRDGVVERSLIRFDLDTLIVTAPHGGLASVAALHGLAGVQHTGDGYDVRWAGDDGSALTVSVHQPDTADFNVSVAASDLQLAPLLPWLALKSDLSPQLTHWLGSGRPRGELDDVAFHWSRAAGLSRVTASFHELGIEPVDGLPGISSLRGQLRGDTQALSLELPQQATILSFPGAFREPFALSNIAATLAFWQHDGDRYIGMDTLDFSGDGYAGQVRGEIILPEAGGKPFVDMYASLDHADVLAAQKFWPLKSMSPGTIAWLDRGLLGGSVDQANVVLRGNMADFPFRHNEGRFEGRAVISDLTLDYGKGWPNGEGINAVATFVNTGMVVEASAGGSLGVKAERAVAVIPDFHQPMLDLNVRGGGSGASLMNFVRRSPIGAAQTDVLGKMKLGGSASFNFHLILPLDDDESTEPRLEGVAQLKGVDVNAPDWNLKLDKLAGPLAFDLHGMSAQSLALTVRGQPSTLQLAVSGANPDPATVLSAQLRGQYRLDELVQDYPALEWLGQIGEGRSPFQVGFTLARQPDKDALAQTLTIDSSLLGIALDLPTPLDKTAATRVPLHLSMSLPAEGSHLRFSLGDVLRGYLRLPQGDQQPFAGTLQLGTRTPQALPQRDLRVRGHATRFDVTGWVQRAVAGSGGDGPGLESLDVDIDQAQWFGRSLGAMKLDATVQPEALVVDVDGAAMLGNYNIPTRELNKRGVTARLKRLYWPTDPTPSATPAVAQAPTTAPASAATTAAVVAPAVASSTAVPANAVAQSLQSDPADSANTGINPAALPPFHIWVGDLRMGDAKLGEARLETWPTPEGLHIEQLRALTSRVQITGSGDWKGDASHSSTHMRINFAAEDLGAMLGALGFDGLVLGGKTRNQLDASWLGGPTAISLATMDGTLSIQVNDGRIPEAASPGVGRLLGLVSLAELPRRLTLDFGDVFGKGLAFDSISGDFRLTGGNAITDNLTILGPSADISVTGRTGLRAKDYDQQMVVVPHVGNSLPLVGAVVGGPIGAAAGFAVQGLLGKGLNQAASARYRITGSWDDPVMTLLEKHGSAPPRPAPLLPAPDSMPQRPGSRPLILDLPVPVTRVTAAPAASVAPPARPSSVGAPANVTVPASASSINAPAPAASSGP